MTVKMTGQVLYVYYKVPLDQHAVWAPRVREFQAQLLANWPGLVAELLQRPEVADGKETWMETYRHTQGVGDDLVAAVAQGASGALLPAPRHTERFVQLR